MKTVVPLSPEHQAIDDTWSEFFEQHQSKLPVEATSLTLGAVFLALLEMYNPPVEEISKVMLSTLVVYADKQNTEHEGYLN
jgi:hypothetical protein